jgi:hypothetical protein
MSLLDEMTDQDVISLRCKNVCLRETLESQGKLNAKLKSMLDEAIDKSIPFTQCKSTKDAMHQQIFRDLEKSVGMSADQVHPGKPEETAPPEVLPLDG